MIKIFFALFGLLVIVGISVFVYSVITAESVDAKEPFLHDDYDPQNDPTNKAFESNSPDM